MLTGLKKAQFVYILIINDSFHLMRTYFYIIRHALKQKHKYHVWSFYIPMYQCAMMEFLSRCPEKFHCPVPLETLLQIEEKKIFDKGVTTGNES